MTETRKTWRSRIFDRLGAAAYDGAIERETVARVLGALGWSTDTRLFYDRLEVIGTVPDRGAVLDIPCGGGVAFRGMRAGQPIRYVAGDLSPGMLRRAKRVALRLGHDQIEFVETDVGALPFEDATFEMAVTYNGLHCFPDPAAGLTEIVRCLKPGGRLAGCVTVLGAGRREDALYRVYQRTGIFGPGGTAEELGGWLTEAGLADVSLERSGAWLYFTGCRQSQRGMPDRRTSVCERSSEARLRGHTSRPGPQPPFVSIAAWQVSPCTTRSTTCSTNRGSGVSPPARSRRWTGPSTASMTSRGSVLGSISPRSMARVTT
jgi:SAM-dependent methyltransferase